ncbi:hypothetical protein SDC9_193996 [bioreactor metagenome]|uniref:Uncharacterized protein n=1 Tax=bioreactor metagenome TaxID=1076179 RepID=A0A645I5M2_9ZZZZ
MQIARAAVVAQAAPQRQHGILRCSRQAGHIRKSVQEALVVAQHGADLGLLQHDFRQPDAVRVTGLLPGQMIAAMAGLPLHYGCGNRRESQDFKLPG